MMTGRDLIVYILENRLEDEPIFFDERFLNLMTVEEVARKYRVGAPTVKAWFDLRIVDGVKIGKEIYIIPSNKLPALN